MNPERYSHQPDPQEGPKTSPFEVAKDHAKETITHGVRTALELATWVVKKQRPHLKAFVRDQNSDPRISSANTDIPSETLDSHIDAVKEHAGQTLLHGVETLAAAAQVAKPALLSFAKKTESSRPMSRREFIAGALALGATAGSALSESEWKLPTHSCNIETLTKYIEGVPHHEFFDRDDLGFDDINNGGNYSKEERAKRTETLPGGEVIFHDAGLDFYRIQADDTISGIIERLGKYSEYSHLQQGLSRIDSFNIRPDQLRAGEWLPIPTPEKDRVVTDQQMVTYILESLRDMIEKQGRDVYGAEVEALLAQHDLTKIVASMYAVAKKESGVTDIGQYALFRHEKKFNSYSYSHYHILMRDWGLDARKKLNLTEGQLLHPKNGTSLFVGFMLEKIGREKMGEVFPFDGDTKAFAKAYNGSAWASRNPDYVRLLEKYYKQGLELTQSLV